jgi:hypothetical protein
MNFVQQLSLYISITAFVFLILGLYKPWIMLWWEDVQNRRKVIRLYGSIASVAYLAHWIIVLLYT